MVNLESLLVSLLKATTSVDAATILKDLGDRRDMSFGTPLGQSGLEWRLFGDSLSNQSSIGLGSKPGRSITERLTNGIDAILDERAEKQHAAPPASPSEAGQRWFGRPVSGPDSGLYRWNYAVGQYDRKVSVVLLPASKPEAATIDVIDRGIGIPHDKMPQTILSLQQGNKITKKYLAGAYGQGGSATLSFCDYALVVSRSVHNPSETSFTVVRSLSMGDDYKVDAYAYLVVSSEQKDVLSVNMNVFPLYDSMADSEECTRLAGGPLEHGTLVRHYDYRLPYLYGRLGPGTGNLYHFLQMSMFDPLLPIGLADLRENTKKRREVILGSRNRLMKRTEESQQSEGLEEEEAARIQVKHHRSMEYFAPHGGSEPTIGIEYWVVFALRKVKNKLERRAYSNELFVNKSTPIVGTVNGQNHGELPASLIRDVGLPLLARHMVVHIDASLAGARVIRELFSTNRENFKEGPVLSALQDGLLTMLKEDSSLAALERELADDIASESNEVASNEVKRQVADLLLEAGYKPQTSGPAPVEGAGLPGPIHSVRPRPVVPDPLPTLTFPDVTKWEIVYPKAEFQIPLNGLKTVLVETNAEQQFDLKNLVSIRSEPAILDIASKRPLKEGRVSWRLKTNASAAEGDAVKITCTITRPDGTQLISDVHGVVGPAPIKPTKQTKAPIPDFDIQGINPNDHSHIWMNLWPDLDPADSPNEKLGKVAYKVLRTQGKLLVCYSTVFEPFEHEWKKLTTADSPLTAYFRRTYEVWIAYHAILQHTEMLKDGKQDESAEIYEQERCRNATIEIKQALKISDNLHRLSVSKENELQSV